MDTFATTDDAEAVIGELCRRLLADDEIGPKLAGLQVAMQLVMRDPDARVTMDCRTDPTRVDVGEVAYPVATSMQMTATDCHKLWLGTLNPVLGMASGKIRPTGEIKRAMALQSVLKPAHVVYRQLLDELGRQDLIA